MNRNSDVSVEDAGIPRPKSTHNRMRGSLAGMSQHQQQTYKEFAATPVGCHSKKC